MTSPALQCDYSTRAHCNIDAEMIYCIALSYTQFQNNKCISKLWDMHPKHTATAEVNLVRYGISLRYGLNQHLGWSQASEDLLHICSRIEHPNTKTQAHFSCSASQMAGDPTKTETLEIILNCSMSAKLTVCVPFSTQPQSYVARDMDDVEQIQVHWFPS